MTEGRRNLNMYLPVYIIFLGIYLFASIIDPNFFTWGNNMNLFARITPLVFAGMAQTFVILTAGIDLSIGSIISLTNVIAASLPWVDTSQNIILWIFIPPLVGLSAGMFNGVIITRGGFPPLIVTLATGAIYKGISLFIMPEPGGSISLAVARKATGNLMGIIPSPLIIFLAVVFACHIILNRTDFGRSVYAIGGNETIAYQSGIPCTRIKTLAYGMSGLLGAFGGMFLSARIFSGDPLIGDPYLLNSIAVAVISGTSLAGGRGGVAGIIGGAYIFFLISNILNLLGISSFYQYVVRGLVLIAALTVTSLEISLDIKVLLRRIFHPSISTSTGEAEE